MMSENPGFNTMNNMPPYGVAFMNPNQMIPGQAPYLQQQFLPQYIQIPPQHQQYFQQQTAQMRPQMDQRAMMNGQAGIVYPNYYAHPTHPTVPTYLMQAQPQQAYPPQIAQQQAPPQPQQQQQQPPPQQHHQQQQQIQPPAVSSSAPRKRNVLEIKDASGNVIDLHQSSNNVVTNATSTLEIPTTKATTIKNQSDEKLIEQQTIQSVVSTITTATLATTTVTPSVISSTTPITMVDLSKKVNGDYNAVVPEVKESIVKESLDTTTVVQQPTAAAVVDVVPNNLIKNDISIEKPVDSIEEIVSTTTTIVGNEKPLDSSEESSEIILDSAIVSSTVKPRRYQTSDLINVRKSRCCSFRPDNLPHIPGVTLEEHEVDEIDLNLENMVNRLKKQKGHSQPVRNSFKGGNTYNRHPGGGYGRPQQQQDQLIINLPNRRDMGFKEAPNAYKPLFKLPQNETEDKKLNREVINLLNKLTPENFPSISKKVQALKIQTLDDMLLLCETLFEKATKERAYAETFARLCNDLKDKISITDGDKTVLFKGAIIKCCQTLFETELKTYLEQQEAILDSEIQAEEDVKTKMLLENNKQDRLKLKEDQYYGNMKFIGELIKYNVIGPKIFFHCSSQLMVDKTSALDCLCELYCTVGQLLDKDNNQREMNQAFEFVKAKSLDVAVESRVRFKLQDLIELRSRQWRKREIQERLQCVPMTLKEMREKTHREDMEKEEVIKNSSRQNRNQRGGVQVGGGGNGGSNNSYNRQQISKKINASTLVLTNTSSVAASSFLGPSESIKNWSQGSGAGPSHAQKSKDSTASSNPEGWKNVGNSQSLQSNKKPQRNQSLRPAEPAIGLSNRFCNQSGKMSAHTSGRSTPTQIDNSPLKGSNSSIPSASEELLVQPTPTTTCDRSQMDRKVDWALQEYVSHNDFDQLDLQIPPSDYSLLVDSLINFAIEKCSVTKQKAGEFMLKLKIPKNDLIEGINAVLENAEDIKTDVPALWVYIGNILEGLLYDQDTDMSFLTSLNYKTDEIGFAKMLSTLFHSASKRLGHTVVGECFRHSGLNWSLLLPKTAISDFLTNENLNFTVSGINRQNSLSIEHLKSRLLEEKHLDNEKIFDFIEENINPKDVETPLFITALTDFVLCSSFANGQYSENAFKEKIKVVHRYVVQRSTDIQYATEQAIFEALKLSAVINTRKFKRDMLDELVTAQVLRRDIADEFQKRLEDGDDE